MSYNINFYTIRNGDKKELKVLSTFRNHKSNKSYIVVDTGKTDKNDDILAYAFIFDPDILEQEPELITNKNDRDIVINYVSNKILSKIELFKMRMPEQIFKTSNLLFTPDEDDIFLIVSVPCDPSDAFLQFIENEIDGDKRYSSIHQFKKHMRNNDIKRVIEKIDKEIERLEYEDWLSIKKKLSENLDDVTKKIDSLFKLSKLYTWVVDEIKSLKEIIKVNQERFLNEKYEIDALDMLAESIAGDPQVITESIKSAMILLCKHGCTNRRPEQALKFVPQEDIVSYNNLLYELIIMFPKCFDYKLAKKTADYFYKNDDFLEALGLFRVATDISSKEDIKLQAQLNNDIGCCLVELQNVNGAIEAFKKATEHDNQFSTAYNNWAYTLAVECDTISKNEIWKNKLTDALTQIKIALALNSGDISYYTNKVQIEYELGNYKEVLNDCEKACDISQSFDDRKVLLQKAILSKLELYEIDPQINAISFDGIYDELEEIYKNESGDKKFFNKGMEIFVNTKDTYENLKELAFWLSLFEFITDKIKSELVVRDSTCEIAYYTKMKNLYNILNDEKDEVKYRLPLFDVDYMNDPNEGVALSKFLFTNITNFDYEDFCKGPKNESGRSTSNKSYTFLKSFSKVVDTLPMWAQYGDDGKGCCIKINPKLFTNLNYQSKTSEKFFEALPFKDDYRLYKVAYIENQRVSDEKHSDLNKLLRRQVVVLDQIGSLIKNLKEKEKKKVVNAIIEILSGIKYLFKDSTYSYEQEVRIIIRREASDIVNPKCDIDIKYREHDASVPKIYTCLAKSTMISEIILGPKVFNADDHIPYISMQLQKLKDSDDSTAIITRSSINYR